MIYNWYLIFNIAAFEALDLVSKTYKLQLEDVGLSEVLVTKGEALGVTYDGVFLSLGMNDKSPFELDGYAIYELMGDVYLGILVPEEE